KERPIDSLQNSEAVFHLHLLREKLFLNSNLQLQCNLTIIPFQFRFSFSSTYYPDSISKRFFAATVGSMKSPRLSNCRLDSNATLKPGDITWVKLRGYSWWPAQVVDEKSVSENCKPRRMVKRAVLLRLYGSYEYTYHLEPVKSLMEFKNILEQQNTTSLDMFQKSIDQVMLNSSDESDNNSDSGENKRKQRISKESSKKAEMSSPSENSNKRFKCRTKQEDAEKVKCDDIPVDDITAPEKTPDYVKRRLKVMQSLGLAAPMGSPFYRKGYID
ncbi:hypothetical protein V2J09_013878, partial [Rumex salicifolius]